jgi:hypothetical protein
LEELKEETIMRQYGVQTDVEVIEMLDIAATQKEVFLLYLFFYFLFSVLLCLHSFNAQHGIKKQGYKLVKRSFYGSFE